MKSKPNKKINGKFIPRLLMLSFIIIACAQTIGCFFLFNFPEYVLADPIDPYTLQVPIGETSLMEFNENSTAPIADYIKTIYKYAIGSVGILAAVMLMVGGVIWLTAGGSAGRVALAKDFIASSLTGLVLVLCSYLILYQINPDLVNLKTSKIKPIEEIEEKESGTMISYTGCDWSASVTCPEGKTKVDGQCDPQTQPSSYDSISMTTKPTGICCCDQLKWDQWIYDPGIKKQIKQKHASDELHDFMECLRKELKPNVGRVSSISDSSIVKNDWDFCKTNYDKNSCKVKSPPCCRHSKTSCHYGGNTNEEKSYAIDFGDQENYAKIKKAAVEKCKIPESYILLEPTHVHISVPGCRGPLGD